jgi:Pentapeptide repeats (8 copies)
MKRTRRVNPGVSRKVRRLPRVAGHLPRLPGEVSDSVKRPEPQTAAASAPTRPWGPRGERAAPLAATATPPATTRPRREQPTSSQSPGFTPRSSFLIRWFTPRGRAVRRELVEHLRHAEGRHLFEVLADLRQDGLPDDVLDLRGIDLRDEDLAGARLPRADLSGARLVGVNLAQADLRRCVLHGANLTRADLRGADLRGARLKDADLSQADLSEANLEGAQVRGAVLRQTGLRRTWVRGVDLQRAHLEDVDTSQVRREEFRPSPPSTRRHEALGRPPISEPRGPSERKTKSATRILPRTGDASPPAAVGGRTFEEALAQLLLERGRVERIEVVLDGERRVLFAS